MNTRILFSDNDSDLKQAAKIIINGGLVAFPTETVYGLGGNALDEKSSEKIYKAKGRPSDNPLIIHLAFPGDASNYSVVNDEYLALAREFMPGPLTVILPKKDNIPYKTTGGLDSVAIRVPEHKTAHRLIELAGVPIAAPSANISGKPSPTSTSHVIADMMGKIDAIISGDNSEVGVESTIISLVTDVPTILRPGAVTLEMIKEILPNVQLSSAVLGKYEGAPLSPGMRYKHYSPNANVTILEGDYEKIVEFLSKQTDSGKLCFEEDTEILSMKNSISYGSKNDSLSQANRLFSCLRDFDTKNEITQIYSRMPSKDGVGLAVLNRLIRAAGFNIIKL